MVNLRMQYRKNYDEKKIANTIYAREMKVNKEKVMKRRREQKRKERKKQKELETHRLLADYINQKELEYCSSPEAKEMAMRMINDVSIITREREIKCIASIYTSTYDTVENKMNRLNKKLSTEISLNTQPDDISRSDTRIILNVCKQFLEEEKELRETVKFGKFNGPQGCDLHRNTVSEVFVYHITKAVEAENDSMVSLLTSNLEQYHVVNPDGEFDIFDLDLKWFIEFTRHFKYVLKSSRRRRKPYKQIPKPIEEKVDRTEERAKRLLRRVEKKQLLDTPSLAPIVEPEIIMEGGLPYVESDDEDEWGYYEDPNKEFDTSECKPIWTNEGEEEFDAGF
jgi:hypothetical protein